MAYHLKKEQMVHGTPSGMVKEALFSLMGPTRPNQSLEPNDGRDKKWNVKLESRKLKRKLAFASGR